MRLRANEWWSQGLGLQTKFKPGLPDSKIPRTRRFCPVHTKSLRAYHVPGTEADTREMAGNTWDTVLSLRSSQPGGRVGSQTSHSSAGSGRGWKGNLGEHWEGLGAQWVGLCLREVTLNRDLRTEKGPATQQLGRGFKAEESLPRLLVE